MPADGLPLPVALNRKWVALRLSGRCGVYEDLDVTGDRGADELHAIHTAVARRLQLQGQGARQIQSMEEGAFQREDGGVVQEAVHGLGLRTAADEIGNDLPRRLLSAAADPRRESPQAVASLVGRCQAAGGHVEPHVHRIDWNRAPPSE